MEEDDEIELNRADHLGIVEKKQKNLDTPLDELQQLLDEQILILKTKHPERHVFVEQNDTSPDRTAEKDRKYYFMKKVNHARRLLLKKSELLTKLEDKLLNDISANEEKKKQIEKDIEMINNSSQNSGRQPSFTRKTFKRFGIPYFHDSKGFTHDPNEDVVKKKKNKELNILSIPKVYFWSKFDKNMLVDCVRNTLVEEHTERFKKEIFKLNESLEHEKNVADATRKIEKIQQKLIDLKNQSFSLLVSNENPDREYDWMKFSATHFNGIHSADECRRFWHLYLKPSINKSKWTTVEDSKLIKIVDQKQGQDWDSIANLLGTNRTAYQCFIHYQTCININSQYSTEKWTKEEDKKLIQKINEERHGDYIPWTKVAARFPNRSHYQVYTRWNYSLNPKLVKGSFSKEEDVLVVAGIEVFGANYSELASLMENRSVCQIRDRYERHLLSKKTKIGTWSLKEDKKLLRLVNKYGNEWAKISEIMVTRSRTQVRQRYKTIEDSMKRIPGWTIEKSRRINNSVDLGKSLRKTWRKVEKIREEIDSMDKHLNLSTIEKKTFRLEKLKELKDYIKYPLKKCNPKRKKKGLLENTELSNCLMEYFKPSFPNPIINTYDASKSQGYLNEMLDIARHLGYKVNLPKSLDEVMSNARLNTHLKCILKYTIQNSEESEEPEPQPKIYFSSMNIDYVPPATDDTIIANEFWFTSPIDISCLNFAELFKTEVFDYSWGMHKDIWSSKMIRNVTKSKPVVQLSNQDSQSCPISQLIIPPNIITCLGLRTLILSQLRLKKDAKNEGFSKCLQIKNPIQISEVADSTEAVNDQEKESLHNVNDSKCQRNSHEESKTYMQCRSHFQQTLTSLFTWPIILSLCDINGTSYNKQPADSKVLSLIDGQKEWSDDDSFELKNSKLPKNQDLPINNNKNMFKRNFVERKRVLAHKKENKSLKKAKIDHLKKRTKKSRNGLHQNKPVIGKQKLKRSVLAEVIDLENNKKLFSVMVPDTMYQKKTEPNMPSCS